MSRTKWNLAGQRPGAAHLRRDQAVGFGVVNELLLGWIPLERAAQAHRQVVQVADGCGAVARLRMGHRLLAALDAINEVALMPGAAAKLDFPVADRLLEQRGRLGLQS